MKIALVDDKQNDLDEMAGLVCDFGTQRHCHMDSRCVLVFLPSGSDFMPEDIRKGD